ncbi:MAG: histidine phosphatase family protein [Sphingopyxis sp.]
MAINGRIFIARHGETVFNAAKRMQGNTAHTPLTSTGCEQANAMGAALATWLGTHQALELWSSPAGRALQTMAIITGHIGDDYFHVPQDSRLREIDTGIWGGRPYADVLRDHGPFIDPQTGLFTQVPTGGEDYAQVAARLQDWVDSCPFEPVDRLVVMHGMSSRVLRGLLLGLPVDPRFGAPIAPSVSQGSLVMIGGGVEKLIRIDPAGDHE